jgi:hypothetical protein
MLGREHLCDSGSDLLCVLAVFRMLPLSSEPAQQRRIFTKIFKRTNVRICRRWLCIVHPQTDWGGGGGGGVGGGERRWKANLFSIPT